MLASFNFGPIVWLNRCSFEPYDTFLVSRTGVFPFKEFDRASLREESADEFLGWTLERKISLIEVLSNDLDDFGTLSGLFPWSIEKVFAYAGTFWLLLLVFFCRIFSKSNLPNV